MMELIAPIYGSALQKIGDAPVAIGVNSNYCDGQNDTAYQSMVKENHI